MSTVRIALLGILMIAFTFPAFAQKTPDKPVEPEVYTNRHLEESARGVFTSTVMCRDALTRQQYLGARDQYREAMVWNDWNRRDAFRSTEAVERTIAALGDVGNISGMGAGFCNDRLARDQAEFERISEAVGYDPS